MNRQAGFSLPELMVTTLVMMIIVAAILTQVKSAFQVSTATYEMTEAQQGLRIAHEYITRDLVSGGDGLRGLGNIRVRQTFVQNYLTTTPVLNALDPGYVSLPILTSDDDADGATPVGGAAPGVNLLEGTDRITMLCLDANFTPISLPQSAVNNTGTNVTMTSDQFAAGNFVVGGIYFINSERGATFGAVTGIIGATTNNPTLVFANDDPYGLNLVGNNGAIRFIARGPHIPGNANGQPVPTSLMRMRMIQYYVNNSGVLVRRVFGAGGASGFTTSTIAEGVTGFALRYFLQDAPQPVTLLTTSPQQVAVRQVEVALAVQTAHAVIDGQAQTMSATTSTSVRNLQFRNAL